MRYNIRQIQLLEPESAVSEEWVIKELKRRIVLELVDKLPFKVERGVMDNPNTIAIELDVMVMDAEKLLNKLRDIYFDEESCRQTKYNVSVD